MIIGVPKEIKNHEYRVGLTPTSVRELTSFDHKVYVESDAGLAIGFSNQDYIQAGANIVPSANEIFTNAEMIVKVKEPLANERSMLRHEQILFTFLHLAPDETQTQDLVNSRAICIAYETITDSQGKLPLLSPMSEVAGRMSIQAGASALERSRGGSGTLISGVPGVPPANVLILGGGVVGANAARMAVGLRANVTVIDKSIETLRMLDNEFQGRAKMEFASKDVIDKHLPQADLVIGAVLIPGARAPKLISISQLSSMKKGAAIVDVAIDQGGCFESSHPTTHAEPTYVTHDVVHYCVANMPGAVARTATLALNNVTLPYILRLANNGYRSVLSEDMHFLNGLNVFDGKITCKEVADAFDIPYVDPRTLF